MFGSYSGDAVVQGLFFLFRYEKLYPDPDPKFRIPNETGSEILLYDRFSSYALPTALIQVHPQNVRFQNVRFQNVRFQNVWNVRFTKHQVYKTSGLQNVRFTKRQVFKTSGWKKASLYILYLWLVKIRRLCCSHVCRQSDGCVLFSILEVFFAIYQHKK